MPSGERVSDERAYVGVQASVLASEPPSVEAFEWEASESPGVRGHDESGAEAVEGVVPDEPSLPQAPGEPVSEEASLFVQADPREPMPP